MKRTLYIFSLLVSLLPLSFANQRIQGWCEKGATQVVSAGVKSTTKTQGSFPSCLVTVYISGSGGTLASLYSDDSGTPLNNPFTADSTGHWFYYTADGDYDTQLSGSGFSSPYTLGAMNAIGYRRQAGTGSVDRNYGDKIYELVSVKDFGAVGNGVAIDRPAIQLALNASSQVYFPAGSYLLDSTPLELQDKQVVTCAGRKVSIIVVPAGATGLQKDQSINDAVRNGSIHGCGIELLGAGSIGIDACGISRWNFEDNDIYTSGAAAGAIGIKGHCGYQYSSYYNNINNSHFGVIGGVGVQLTDAANQYVITGNTFNPIGAGGIGIQFDGGTNSQTSAQSYISGPTNVIGNAFEDTAGVGVSSGLQNTTLLNAYNLTLAHNRFEGGGTFQAFTWGAGLGTPSRIMNWISGGVASTDTSVHPTVMDGRTFGGGVLGDGPFDFVFPQWMHLTAATNSDMAFEVDSGDGTSGKRSIVYLTNNGVRKWQIVKQADDSFCLAEYNSAICRIAITAAGQTIVNSGGATAIRLNSSNTGTGTGGVEFGDGAAHKVAWVLNNGTVAFVCGGTNCATSGRLAGTFTNVRTFTFPDLSGNVGIQAGTPMVAGRAVCVKVVSPLQYGFCSSQPDASGACTCN